MKAEAQPSRGLQAILAETARRVAAARTELARWEEHAARAGPPPDFARALRRPYVAVIAEVKRRSPSAGAIQPDADAVALASAYAAAGAAAVSVLTEPTFFGGSLDDLERVARAVPLPTLRKDFIIDPVQLYEARAAGAAAVLLIVRALERERLFELAAAAHAIGLATLVEVHSAEELAAAIEARPTAIGVNARDLATLAMESDLHAALVPRVPADLVAVAESGLASRADVVRAGWLGADAVLVGTAVGRSADPGAALAALVDVPREPRGAVRG